MTLVREITRCRACRDPKLDPVLDLGCLAISDFLAPGQEVERAPLCLVRCAGCGLVQLRHTVHRDRLYTSYWYRSSTNETMVAALRDVVKDARSRVDLRPGDTVLDIGCNDGTLFDHYPLDIKCIGFDPSDVAQEAWLEREYPYDLVRDYFPTRRQHTPTLCKVITAVACFYDVDDPGAFLDEAKRWLHPEGVLVLQFQDAWSMLRADAVDNVCHEHLTYWNYSALAMHLVEHGLESVSWSHHPINGGSIRVVARHRSPVPVKPPLGERPPTVEVWRAFARRVEANKRDTLALLHNLKAEGKSVYGLAASTKWNTLSQFYGVGPDLLPRIAERSAAKWGKRTVTGSLIVPEDELWDAQPDYLFVCAWGFADAFAERYADLLARGTRLIVPLPRLRIIESTPRHAAHDAANGVLPDAVPPRDGNLRLPAGDGRSDPENVGVR